MTCCNLSGGGDDAVCVPAAWPQQRLYFLPLPHGQGAFLDGLLWTLPAVMGLPGVDPLPL